MRSSGGTVCSSEEISVMEMERRDGAVLVLRSCQPIKWEECEIKTKSFEISKIGD